MTGADGPDRGAPTRTIFLGSGGFGEPSLRALAAMPAVDLVGVVTAPARPAGRTGAARRTPIADLAAQLDLGPVLTPDRLRSAAAIATILALRPELAILADFGQIVPAELLDLPSGALNLHPSLLPRHRGATPIPAAILAGDAETGVSLFRMDAGLDTGPVLATRSYRLRGAETAPDLEATLAQLAAELLTAALPTWLAGRLEASPQGAAGASLTRPLIRDDGRLDPARPAVLLERQVRAFQPWPGSFLDTPIGRLVVWSAELAPTPGPPDTEAETGLPSGPGTIVARGTLLDLVTVDGRLRLLEVQPAGGRRMLASELLRGRGRSLLDHDGSVHPAG